MFNIDFLQTITVRWVQHPTQTGSSGESSSSDSEISNNVYSSHHTRVLDSIDPNAESALPSVVIKPLLSHCSTSSISPSFRYFQTNMKIINFLLNYPI